MFFVVGGMRCGTTSLWNNLKDHPEIFVTKIKETEYFSSKNMMSEKSYFDLFKIENEKIAGECSTIYLRDPISSKLIKENFPNAKIIIILRDPTERALSHYLSYYIKNEKFDIANEINVNIKKFEKNDFKNVLTFGTYSEQIQRFIDLFGKNNVKIIYFENYIQDFHKTILDVFKFLDVSTDITIEKYKENDFFEPRRRVIKILRNPIIRNIGKIVNEETRDKYYKKFREKSNKKPKLNKNERNILREFYKDEIEKVEKITGVKTKWGNNQ